MVHQKGKHPAITHREEERFITGIRNGVVIGFRYFAFKGPTTLKIWVRGKGKGKFLISNGKKEERKKISVKAEKNWAPYETILSIEDTSPLYLEYKGNGELEMLKLELEEIE